MTAVQGRFEGIDLLRCFLTSFPPIVRQIEAETLVWRTPLPFPVCQRSSIVYSGRAFSEYWERGEETATCGQIEQTASVVEVPNHA